MRSLVRLFSVNFLLLATSAAQAQFNAPVAGTVTLVDTKRSMLVLQDRGQALGIMFWGETPVLKLGARVILDGRVQPYCQPFPNFPDDYSSRTILQSFSAPADADDHYLSRFRGFLRVPVDGNYTFWLMADDEAELLLSSNSNSVMAKAIATVRAATRVEEWDRDAAQKSQVISLRSSQLYYIEARHREWRGHDHLAVAWQGPGFGRKILSGESLLPWDGEGSVTNGILREVWTNCFLPRLALLSAQAQNPAMVRISEARVTANNPGELPAPRRVRIDQKWTTGQDFKFVEVEGVVTFAAKDKNGLQLELAEVSDRKPDSGVQMTVRVLNWDQSATATLVNRKVRVRGVCERVWNDNGEAGGAMIWAQDERQLELLDYSDRDARELDLVSLFELTPTNLNLAWGRKVLVRGTVLGLEDSPARQVVLRGDDSFCAYQSSDGTNWQTVGVPVPVAMSDTVYAGLVAAANTNSSGAEAKFGHVSNDFKKGVSVGIGNVSTNDSVVVADGNITLRPNGGNDWVAMDKALFHHQSLTGEGAVVAELESFKSGRISDKAGLMIRDALSPDAAYVALVMTHNTRLDLIYRSVRRANSKSVFRGASEVPRWLKLVRQQHFLNVQMLEGERVRLRQHVELVGLLQWRDGKPFLTDAYVRSPKRLEQPSAAVGDVREVRIAELPAETTESEQSVGENYLIRGVVTFAGRAFGRDWLFVQDESGAASLRASPTFFRERPVEAGQMLEAKGDVSFAPGLAPFRLNTSAVLGWGKLPAPQTLSDRSDARQAENFWVELTGVVRVVSNNVITLMTRGGPVSVWVGGNAQANELAGYIDTRVIVRGVFTLQAIMGPAVLVPAARFISVREAPPADPFLIPSHAINRVVAPNQDADQLRRAKVIGVVTYRDEGSLIVQDQTGGARIYCRGPVATKVGDRVEVVGFPELDGESVTLSEALLRNVEGGRMPEPLDMMLDGLLEGRLNLWLVQMDGILLSQKTRQGQQLLELQDGQRVFEAVLSERVGLLNPMPIGSRVQVSGVAQLQLGSHPPPGQAGRGGLPVVATMDVLMRTPADLVLLERPPWWTWKHTATLGAILFAILAGALVWIRTLRRRVAQRTSELQSTMHQLKQETELSATLAERERLAAEIHDTLEQGLSGIMMQLDGVDSRLAQDQSGARENLELARRMVRFSRAEVRHSLWNLESQLLKDGDLGAAIREIARQMTAGSTTAVSVEVSAEISPLPAAVEHHLLRCCQEALSNALKHSGARVVCVQLTYRADLVELAVADDGCGFDSAAVLTGRGMHLGLRNLRSRARKMKGQLEIVSQPQSGTTVRLTVPVSSGDGRNTSVR